MFREKFVLRGEWAKKKLTRASRGGKDDTGAGGVEIIIRRTEDEKRKAKQRKEKLEMKYKKENSSFSFHIILQTIT